MIAMRFRSVGWVAAVATAALGCYLVTQRVAGERRQLAGVERDILHGRREIRQLEVEIETRSRMTQLERWNADVLALTAPTPRQYLGGEVQLSALNGGGPVAADPAAAHPAARAVRYEAPAVAKPAHVVQIALAEAADAGEPVLRHATYVRPKDRMAAKPAPVTLASAGFAAELDQIAASEARKTRRP